MCRELLAVSFECVVNGVIEILNMVLFIFYQKTVNPVFAQYTWRGVIIVIHLCNRGVGFVWGSLWKTLDDSLQNCP